MEQIQNLIEEENKRSQKANAIKNIKDTTLKMIQKVVQELHICVNPLAIPETNILELMSQIKEDLGKVMTKIEVENIPKAVEETVSALNSVFFSWTIRNIII